MATFFSPRIHLNARPSSTPLSLSLESTASLQAKVAIAWVAAKGSLPIIRPRTVAQLQGNLLSVNVKLSPGQIARLDKTSEIPTVFPYNVINGPGTRQGSTGGQFDQFDAPAVPVA